MPKEFLRSSKNFGFCSKEIIGSLKKNFSLLAVTFFLLFPTSLALANNISVTNAGLISKDTGAGTVQVQFNVSWDNSWRDATNYDAAWVFVKYCTSNCSTNGSWLHATMKTSGTNPAGVSRGTGTTIDVVVSADKKGAFLQRSGNGTGTLSTTGVQLVWDYAANGVSDANADGINTRIKVFAIEMVYVPQGSFYAGDGNEAGAKTPATAGFKMGSSCRDPWSITGEGAISVTNQGVCSGTTYYYTSAGLAGEDVNGTVFSIPDAYPKGYAAFYMMKYEMSNGQYRDFLNCLTRGQQQTRVNSVITADTIPNYYVMTSGLSITAGASVRAPTSGNGTVNPVVFFCDRSNIGAPFNGDWTIMYCLLWPDSAAYADWSALRPMTELEYEKAARGAGVTPLNLEYAWGAATGGYLSYYIAMGFINESMLYTTAAYDTINGLRCGLFADASDTTRLTSGAAYYGALDLSAGTAEPAVTVGNPTGRAYTGTHGDGLLSASGNATNSDWPGYVTSEVTGYTGIGYRGGYSSGGTTTFYVSVRNHAAQTGWTNRVTNQYAGGRFVRTASA